MYPTGRASSRGNMGPRRAQPERARLQFERVSSPRKRKRSPEPPPDPSAPEMRQQPKPPAERSTEEEEDDFLDELGCAALDDYELTQRLTSSHEPSTSELNQPWSSGVASAGTTSKQVYPSVMIPPGSHMKEMEATSSVTASTSQGGRGGSEDRIGGPTGGEDRGEIGEAEERVRELREKLKELEEKSYKRDGEVTLLRKELKKKEDQLREMHTRLVSEHQQKEDELSRQTKSLSTQLEFKDQELAALRERCSSLEQRQKNQSSVIHTSPVAPPQKPGGQKSSDFLSTENFMPLSQMRSQGDVTPIHVSTAAKRSSHSLGNESKVSPEAKRAAPGQLSAIPGPSPASAGLKAHGAKAAVPSQETLGAGKLSRSCSPEPSEPVFNLPPPEISSQELLMLLARPELLKVPKLRSDEEDSAEAKDESVSLLGADGSSLPGLFSLLHIPQSSSSSTRSTPLFPSGGGLSTPVSRFQDPITPTSAGNSSMSNPSSELSSDSFLPSTPARKSRLHSRLPHTCARTDVSKSRIAEDNFPLRKAQSASNTPVQESSLPVEIVEKEPEGISQSLLDSLDVESITGSIRSMLTDRDISLFSHHSGFSSLSATPFPSAPPSLSNSAEMPDCGLREGDSPTVVMQLLEHIGDVVIQYVREQTDQVHSTTLNATSNHSEHDSFDNTQSPKSSAGSNTGSSVRNTADLKEPSRADQSFLYRILTVLQTLLTYSSKARDQLIAPLPPRYSLDDEVEPTVLEAELVKEAEGGGEEGDEIEEEGEREARVGSAETPKLSRESSETQPRTMKWKGMVLEQMAPTGELSRVWIPRKTEEPSSQEAPSSSSRDWRRRRSTSVPLSVTPYGRGARDEGDEDTRRRRYSGSFGGKGEKLLSSLLQLVSPQWKESNEVILLGLKLLFILARDCPYEQLERFSHLLGRDGLDTYLAEEPPNPSLSLESLKLLTCLSNSPQLTNSLCSKGDPSYGCLLSLCYDFFTKKVTEDAHVQYLIHSQLVQLVSNISMVEGGPSVLFESACPCCMEVCSC
jgi:hypothetical protein